MPGSPRSWWRGRWRVAAGIAAGALVGVGYALVSRAAGSTWGLSCNPAVAGLAGAFIGAVSFGGERSRETSGQQPRDW